MLFHSSIRKELARSFVATLVVLITVVMSMLLIRTLGLAAKGSVNPSDVIMLMGYSVLGQMATIMTLALFVSVTNTLSRMYRDSEMAVWFASGHGLAGFVAPVFRFAWPILLAIAAAAMIVWPWTAQQTNVLRSQYEQRSDLDRVSIGQFQENASGSRVFFVEASERENGGGSNGISGNSSESTPSTLDISSKDVTSSIADLQRKQARNIFISAQEKGQQIITTARSGKIDTIDGDQFIVLSQGQRLDQKLSSTISAATTAATASLTANVSPAPVSTPPQNASKSALKISQFEQYGVLVNPGKIKTAPASPKSLDTLQLLRESKPAYWAELSWRIGLALGAVNLLLLALLLSAVNPRAGQGFGLLFALLAFLVYYNLINVGYSRIAAGRSEFFSWMIMLHGGVLAVSLLWLAIRHHQWSWRHLLPTRAAFAASSAAPA
jgi:lipopolysaccharide export system permease protein